MATCVCYTETSLPTLDKYFLIILLVDTYSLTIRHPSHTALVLGIPLIILYC